MTILTMMTMTLILMIRGVGDGTATTAMAVPFVGTPNLSDTNLFKEKREKQRERK